MNASSLTWTFGPLLLLAAPVLVYVFTQADRLVRAEREFHRDEWERDGSPCGYFAWIVPYFSGDAVLAGCRTSVPWRWKFRTPPWVAASREYRRWLRRYRISILIWDLVCASVFFAMILILLRHNV